MEKRAPSRPIGRRKPPVEADLLPPFASKPRAALIPPIPNEIQGWRTSEQYSDMARLCRQKAEKAQRGEGAALLIEAKQFEKLAEQEQRKEVDKVGADVDHVRKSDPAAYELLLEATTALSGK